MLVKESPVCHSPVVVWCAATLICWSVHRSESCTQQAWRFKSLSWTLCPLMATLSLWRAWAPSPSNHRKSCQGRGCAPPPPPPMFSFPADSSRLVSEARSGRVVEGLPVARVLGHLEATGAKAKPVLRSLYGTVGEMGRTHGYDTTVGMFTQLGFVTEPPTDTGARAGSYQVVNSLLQNSVGPVSHVTLPPCHPAPAPAPTALTCSRHDASTCTG